VGITTIATAVGEETGTLEEVYEPFLIQEGFLMRTPRGREVTAKAYEHLGKKRPGGKANYFLIPRPHRPDKVISCLCNYRSDQPEPIAMYIDNLDLVIILQVFAQFGNIYVHAAAIKIRIAAPDLFQRLFPRQQVIHMLGQHFQQLILFWGQGLRLPFMA